jgi:hypothetical protein
MGFDKISYELVTDVVSYNRKIETHDKTVKEYIIDLAKSVSSFTSKQARASLRAEGRNLGNISKVLRTLVEDDLLSISGGQYYATTKLTESAATETKMLPAPKPTQKDISGSKSNMILLFAKSRGGSGFTTTDVKQILTDHGYPEKHAYGILHGLIKNKLVKRLELGQYQVTSKALKADEHQHSMPLN